MAMQHCRSIHAISLLVAITALAWSSFAAEPAAAQPKGNKDLTVELKRIPPTEPKESLATFRVESGFHVEMVAAEPLISDPVDIAWDENGKLYVCELWNYPGEPKAGEPLGRIRLLESTKGDGVYDKSTVFADQIKWPSGVICWDGGIYVLSSPDLWYLKDTTGSGKADLKQKVLTGFRGRTYEVPNSPQWGLDNRIYICGSYAGGNVSSVSPEGMRADPLSARDFRFDPRDGRVEAVSGGGEWGHTFDDWGERFTCDATHLVWHPVLPREELARNPYLIVPSVQEMSIGEWTHIHPISKPEPWKVAREQNWTRWVNSNSDMKADRFPKMELAPQGFATAAAGLTIYRGSAYGKDYAGNAFIGEPANNAVVRLKLRPRGIGVGAEHVDHDARDPGEQREFLASTDNWFRPVNFANGPDGCLYVVAMYREIIEDESAIPNDILKNYNLYTGRERGRILRIVPDGFRAPSMPHLGNASTAQLVAAIAHPDSWWRDTAQRLLYQRQDDTAAVALRKLSGDSLSPQGRIHALWTLHGLNRLDADTVQSALSDLDPHVREQAVHLAEDLLPTSAALQRRVIALADDPENRVRFRVAFALGMVNEAPATDALLKLARRDSADAWMRAAVLAAAANRSGRMLATLSSEAEFRAQSGGAELLGGLSQIAGGRNDETEVSQVLATLAAAPLGDDPALRSTLLRQLADSLARSGGSLSHHLSAVRSESLRTLLASFVERAKRTAFDPNQKPRDRVEAIRLLAHAPFDEVAAPLAELLTPSQPTTIQLAAVGAISAQTDPNVGAILVSRWRQTGPAVRPDLADAIFRRADRLAALLDAIEQRKIPANELDPRRRQSLLQSSDPLIRQRAGKLLALAPSADKNALIARYREQVLKMGGDPQRGELIFKNTCAVCHKPETGVRPGPNLATLEDRSPDTLLIAILDPNREVKPSFVEYLVKTKDGQEFSGVIATETATSVTLRRAGGGEDVVLRRNVQSMRSTGLSLMPDGLETGIDYQQMADLMRFLQTLKD
jgi:putative membrane-bound dehydrogenase-like protein